MTPEYFFSGQQLHAYNLAQRGDIEKLVEAKKSGMDLSRPGKEDLTMLGLAVLTADRQAIISLMRVGADPNQVIPDAGSPAILAITKHYNPPRVEAIAALLDGGYDPNQLLRHGTPYLFHLVDYEHWPGFQLALARGGNINVRRSGGESLLSHLVERHHFKEARELIEMGADVAASGKLGETPLCAIESHIRRANPSQREIWTEMLALRELILSRLPDPKDRHSAFTDAAERKIRENSPPVD